MATKPKQQMTGDNLAETINLWAIAGELGVKLAAPLIIFMIIGIKLDKANHTTPLFMLLGIGLSFTTAVYFVYDLIRRVNRGSR